MKRQVLADLLARHGGAATEGDSLVIPEDREVWLYVAMGTEPLVVQRVAQVSLEAEAAVAQTRRKQTFLVAYEDIRALRVAPVDGERAGYA